MQDTKVSVFKATMCVQMFVRNIRDSDTALVMRSLAQINSLRSTVVVDMGLLITDVKAIKEQMRRECEDGDEWKRGCNGEHEDD